MRLRDLAWARRLALVIAFATLARAEVIDNFNDGNDLGWAHVDLLGVTQYDAGSGAYRVFTNSPIPPSGEFLAAGAVWMTSLTESSYRDGTYSGRMTLANEKTLGGLLMRVDPNSVTGYIFWLDQEFDYAGISRFFHDGTRIVIRIIHEAPYDVEPGVEYWIKAAAIGAEFGLKVWRAADESEPSQPLVTGSDGNIAAGGLGVAIYNTIALTDIMDGRFDDLTFVAGGCEPCDLNCDGSVNQFDILPFVTVLSQQSAGCSPCAADANQDGSINQFDIQGFVTCLGG